jgi:polyhydroxyalkanoate synthesis regulator phasin
MGESHENKEDEMAEYKFGDGIKKFFLAGVGAVAITAEKGQEIIGELVKKGELTVEQGKELNKDLQRSFKESMNERGVDIDELSQKISKMSTDELTKIKEQIAAAQELIAERLKKAEDNVVDAADVVEEAVENAADAAEEKAEDACDKAEEACDKAEEKVEEIKEAVKEASEE